jgi:hypothetical protein
MRKKAREQSALVASLESDLHSFQYGKKQLQSNLEILEDE